MSSGENPTHEEAVNMGFRARAWLGLMCPADFSPIALRERLRTTKVLQACICRRLCPRS